jgi:hypothetical protein
MVESVIVASGVPCGISQLILQPNLSELSTWAARGCKEQRSSKDQGEAGIVEGGQHCSNVIAVKAIS